MRPRLFGPRKKAAEALGIPRTTCFNEAAAVWAAEAYDPAPDLVILAGFNEAAAVWAAEDAQDRRLGFLKLVLQ